jgi:hypothetical protein
MTSNNSKLRSRMHAESRGRRIEVTPRDIEIFSLLDRYRYLPSNFIHAFVGGNESYHKARMTDLFHEGWLRKPRPQWEAMNARYRFDTYELGHKAGAILADRGSLTQHRMGTGNSFRHELMVCLIMASIDLAGKQIGLSLLSWKDVFALAPPTTRDANAPFAIPMTFTYQGRTSDKPLRPDGLPFGLGARRVFWFPGIEVDRHYEPLHPTDLGSRHSSILGKFLQYRHMVRERLFEAHYGMPNVLVPIVTINHQHMLNMIDLALRISDGRGFKWMLFKSIPDFASVEKAIQPNRALLTEPWQRAGNPPLNLMEELSRDL